MFIWMWNNSFTPQDSVGKNIEVSNFKTQSDTGSRQNINEFLKDGMNSNFCNFSVQHDSMTDNILKRLHLMRLSINFVIGLNHLATKAI